MSARALQRLIDRPALRRRAHERIASPFAARERQRFMKVTALRRRAHERIASPFAARAEDPLAAGLWIEARDRRT